MCQEHLHTNSAGAHICCQCLVLHGLRLKTKRLKLPSGVFSLLMAAGMDAQQVEDELTRGAKEAWEAYLAEKDPARSAKLKKRWNKAQDALDSFRRQQVAGGEDPI